jgi:hypothetical protein
MSAATAAADRRRETEELVGRSIVSCMRLFTAAKLEWVRGSMIGAEAGT